MNTCSLPGSRFAKLSYQPLNSQSVSLSDLGEILVIEHQGFDAQISLYGGQVLSFQQKGQQPLFWLTDELHCGTNPSGKQTAIRGGIPICWPWFGPHPDDKTSQHGFARNDIWQLVEVNISESQVTVELVLKGDKRHALFPQPFTLKQRITFSSAQTNAFNQQLIVANESEQRVKYTAALHTYFRVGLPEQVTVKALEPFDYYDKLTDKTYPPSTLANCKGPLDRVYFTADNMLIEDSAWQRNIEVRSQGCQQWVLWNPGQETAENMADVHQGGEQEFVCLEAAATKWQYIEANSTVTLGQTISIKPA